MRSPRPSRPTFAAILLALLTLGAFGVTPAVASPSEEQQGAQLLRGLGAGGKSCRSLSAGQFELIGEYAMGRMLGSSSAHQAMNQVMTSMIGPRGEAQAHTFMGQRFAGCARGNGPASFGTMMGMMGAGMMGGVYGPTGASGASGPSGPSGGMMGGASGPSGYRGGTMGGSYPYSRAGDSGGWSSADTVIVVLLGVLIAGVLALLIVRRPRHGPKPGAG